MKFLLLLLLVPITANAQSVGVGHSYPIYKEDLMLTKNREFIGKATESIALSWSPLKYKFISSGFVLSTNKIPIEKGTHFNFIIMAEIPFNRFSISYKHISNGFGIRNPINIGMDFISIRILL